MNQKRETGSRRFPPRFGEILTVLLHQEIVNFANIHRTHQEPRLTRFGLRQELPDQIGG